MQSHPRTLPGNPTCCSSLPFSPLTSLFAACSNPAVAACLRPAAAHERGEKEVAPESPARPSRHRHHQRRGPTTTTCRQAAIDPFAPGHTTNCQRENRTICCKKKENIYTNKTAGNGKSNSTANTLDSTRDYAGTLSTSSRHFRLVPAYPASELSLEATKTRPHLQLSILRWSLPNNTIRYFNSSTPRAGNGATRVKKHQRSRWQQHRLLQHEDL